MIAFIYTFPASVTAVLGIALIVLGGALAVIFGWRIGKNRATPPEGRPRFTTPRAFCPTCYSLNVETRHGNGLICRSCRDCGVVFNVENWL